MGTILRIFVLLLCTLILTEAQDGKFALESAVIRCSDDTNNDDEKIPSDKPVHFKDSNGNTFEKDIIIPRKCKSEITVTIKVVTSARQGSVAIQRQSKTGSLVQIENAVDENNRTIQLGLPIAVKIQQLPLFQVYSIKYLNTINAKATEEVYNYENTPKFQGCKASGRPLCAIQTDDSDSSGDVTVKEGFCCPCTPDTRDKNGRQIRGGQLCTKDKSAKSFNNTKAPISDLSYASVHCFRQSKHWYAVHEIGPPQIFQEVFLQIFKKVEKDDGTTDWVQVGKSKKPISIDTWLEYEDPQLNVIYRPPPSVKLADQDPLANKRLLIPKVWITDSNKNSTPPAMLGNVDESYLIVPAEIVNAEGVDCDKAGVGYDAFMGQSGNICAKPRGTCLSNQPLDLWASDNKPSAGSSKGHEFKLKHFGSLNLPAPIKRIDKLLYLVFNPQKEIVSYVDIKLQVDDAYLIRPGYGAALLYVISDSSTQKAKLTVQVANKGFVPGYYSVRALDCTDELLPHDDSSSKPKLILPQNITTFTIGLEVGKNLRLSKRATCIVAVVNERNKIVALREALLSPADTCFSNLNCKNVCARDDALKCEQLEVEKVWEAGLDPNWFGGTYEENGFEFLGFNEHNRSPIRIITTIMLIVVIFLLLGLLKAILGKFWKSVGVGGLCYFNDKPRRLSKYFEKHYSHISVTHDEDGYPVDPFTKKPTVQRMSSKQIFLLNIVFFLIFPFLLFMWIYEFCERSVESLSRRSSKNMSRYDKTHGNDEMSQSTDTESPNVPLLRNRSATGRPLLSINTRTKINSLRRSDSSVEYNYRKGQEGGLEYSVNSGEWRPTPTSIFSQSDTSVNIANPARRMSGHVPSSELDMP